MIFKFKFMVQGGHTHYKLWTGKTVHGLGSNGPRLTMTNEEWTIFTNILNKGSHPNLDLTSADWTEEPTEVIFEEVHEGEGWLW